MKVIKSMVAILFFTFVLAQGPVTHAKLGSFFQDIKKVAIPILDVRLNLEEAIERLQDANMSSSAVRLKKMTRQLVDRLRKDKDFRPEGFVPTK